MRRARALRLNKEPRTIFICRHSREILLISFFAFTRKTCVRYVRQTRHKAHTPLQPKRTLSSSPLSNFYGLPFVCPAP
ncbi:hypothetical protein PUN28_006620 [Cardiocondyla obscurior]|uniref:Uncharacterized protein n=1 Tax=Cardiocondyla obscurior TaxID=286306 RepID=A0AAW2GDE2_9HYME